MRLLFCLLLLLNPPGTWGGVPDFSTVGADEAGNFLPVEQAFRFEGREEGANRLRLHWSVAPGYALYRDRIRLQVEPVAIRLAPPAFAQAAVIKDDPSFGPVAVFHDEVDAVVDLAEVPPAVAGRPATVILSYQGCADAGLCYPPQTVRLALPAPVAQRGQAVAPPPALVSAPRQAADTPAAGGRALPSAELGLADAGGIAGFLGQASLPLVLLTFFGLGLGLTFTPCVFPMLPILSGLIAGEDSRRIGAGRALRLSLVYVAGMALTYALVGTLVGYFGARANLQLWLQAPPVLVAFALVFVLLALSMFGLYELQLPAALRERLDALARRQSGGRLLGVFAMGVLSALVVSPCVSAPLAGTLIYIGTTGNAWLGGSALLLLGFGMGTPLVLAGVAGGRLLPRAGKWLLAVKAVFGVGLLAVALWLLARLLPGPLVVTLWALLAGLSGIQMGALESAPPGWARLWKGLGIFLLLYALSLFAGALAGQDDPLRPLGAFTATARAPAAQHPPRLEFERLSTGRELRAALDEAAAQGRGVVVDVYADWCAACQTMERTTFRDPAVMAALASRRRLQLDISGNSAEHRRLLEQFHLYGPPALLFFDAQGQEEEALRVQSEISTAHLLARLRQAEDCGADRYC